MKISSLFLLFLSLFLAGCLSMDHKSNPNWRPAARVDFVNNVPGAVIRVHNDLNNEYDSAPAGYGESGWVPIQVSWATGGPYQARVIATVEIDLNGRKQFVPYDQWFNLSAGGWFYERVMVQGNQGQSNYYIARN